MAAVGNITINVRWRYRWWVRPVLFLALLLRNCGQRIDPDRVVLFVTRHGVVYEYGSGKRWRRIR